MNVERSAMFRERSPQRSLFSASNQYRELIGTQSFYALLGNEAHNLFPDSGFQRLYCDDNGRPCVPPSQMFTLLLLQMHDKCSDVEAIERSRFDVRWAVALDVELGKGLCGKTTLQEFRARMHIDEAAEEQFKATLKLARRLGVLKGTPLQVALDTTPVFGRGAVKDTYNLIADGIRKLVEALARLAGVSVQKWAALHSLSRYWEASSLKGEANIDWSSEQERRIFLNGLVTDAERLLLLADQQAEKLAPEVAAPIKSAAALLRRIIAQDTQPATDPSGPKNKKSKSARPESDGAQSGEHCVREAESQEMASNHSGEAEATESGPGNTAVGESKNAASDAHPNEISSLEETGTECSEVDSQAGPQGEHLLSAMVVVLRQGVTADRIISVHDPDMRHGRKSSSNLFDGYKSSVAVDTHTRLILALEVIAGNASDNTDAIGLVHQAQENSGSSIKRALGDCAYGDGETRRQFREAGIELVSKVPSPPSTDLFPKSRFQLDLTQRIATCPAGQTTTDFDFSRHRLGTTQRVRFSKESCDRCPHRDPCLRQIDKTRKSGRTLVLHPQEQLIQAARLHQASPEFRKDIQARQVVEHVQARMIQLGLRQARYFGRAKTRTQALLIATIANLTLLLRAAGRLFSLDLYFIYEAALLPPSRGGGRRLTDRGLRLAS